MPITVPIPESPIKPMDLRRNSLSFTAKKRLKAEIDSLEKEIKNSNKGHNYIPGEILSQMEGQLRQKKKRFKNNKAPEVTGKTKDKLWERANFLENEIKKRQYSKKDMFEKDPQKLNEITSNYMDHYDETIKIELEYKEIMRRLEPDNPHVTNLERFRR